MNRDILTVIQENMDSFSKGQKKIAGFILDSYDKAAFMTASRLGKKGGVSESTVVRFASELGYDGYPDMQRSLQKMIRNRLTTVQRIEVTNDRLGDQDLLSMVLQSGRPWRNWTGRASTGPWTPLSQPEKFTSSACGLRRRWLPFCTSILT